MLGALIGLLNGLIHVLLRIPSFMASLAMGFVGTGLAVLLTGGEIVKIEDEVFRGLLTERWFGFPLMAMSPWSFCLSAWFIQYEHDAGPELLCRRRRRGTGPCLAA